MSSEIGSHLRGAVFDFAADLTSKDGDTERPLPELKNVVAASQVNERERRVPSSVKFETSLSDRHNAKNSELNIAACHSQFEAACARALDKHPEVVSWARNFQLGWTVPYLWEGTWHRYEPDFVARIFAGRDDEDAVHLIVECKGVPDDHSDRKKQSITKRWIPAVQSSGQLPRWLRRWSFVELTEPGRLAADLNAAIKAARTEHPNTPQQGAA